MADPVLYVVAECPVAWDGGVVGLKSLRTGQFVFFPPCCGVAWREPPLSGRLDEVLSLEDMQLGPIGLPTLDELRKARMEDLIIRTEPVADLEKDVPQLHLDP